MMPDWNAKDEPTTSDAWRFYVRINKDNVAITPDKLAMFMSPEIRRTVIRLESIPNPPSLGVFLLSGETPAT